MPIWVVRFSPFLLVLYSFEKFESFQSSAKVRTSSTEHALSNDMSFPSYFSYEGTGRSLSLKLVHQLRQQSATFGGSSSTEAKQLTQKPEGAASASGKVNEKSKFLSNGLKNIYFHFSWMEGIY